MNTKKASGKNTESKIEEKAKELLAGLLSIVDESKILKIRTNGMVEVGGVSLPPEKLANLKSEAEFFNESELWNLIHDKVQEEAQRIMFVSGKNLEEMQTGRSMLYLLDMQKRFIAIFRSYQTKK